MQWSNAHFVSSVFAFAAAGCGPSTFTQPQNAGSVQVHLRDSPPGIELFPDASVHVHRGRPFTISGSIICTTSPCDATVLGGTVLRAGFAPSGVGGDVSLSDPFPLPPRGDVRISVDPGSNRGQMLSFTSFGLGVLTTFVGGVLLGAAIGDAKDPGEHGHGEIVGGSISVGIGLTLVALGVWGYQHAQTKVTMEPMVHF